MCDLSSSSHPCSGRFNRHKKCDTISGSETVTAHANVIFETGEVHGMSTYGIVAISADQEKLVPEAILVEIWSS